MSNINNYEDIRKNIQETIWYYDGRIKMWEAVKFPTKKDGTPFKVLSKNFDGAQIGAYHVVEGWANPYLTVNGYVKRYGNSGDAYDYYDSDHMEIHVTKYNDRLPAHNDEREVRRNEWGTDIEIMTLDEIKSEIQNRIEMFKRHKAEAEEALAMSEEKFLAVQAKLMEIKEIVYGKDIKCSSLEFALQKYVQGFGKYTR